MLSKNGEFVIAKKTIGQTTRIAPNIFEASWYVCKYPDLNLIDRHPYTSRKFSSENIKEDEILNNYGSGNSAVDNFIKACRRYQSA